MTSYPCSDDRPGPADRPPLSVPWRRLIVLEGMPGAGKTTAALALAERGLPVLGEYIDDTQTTLAISQHPPVTDDDAHQRNWLRKAAQATACLARGGSVYADRDWLSSLSYAYSIAPADGGALVTQRCIWAARHLADGRLLLPGTYVIFSLDPATSLHRRRARLRSGHPWASPTTLQQLCDFYTNPGKALHRVHPGVAEALHQPTWIELSGHSDPHEAARRLTALASQP
jgi:predicted ATPase